AFAINRSLVPRAVTELRPAVCGPRLVILTVRGNRRRAQLNDLGIGMDVNGVAAVVTGAASGLGEATARELAKRGARVAIFDRDRERGEKVASETGGIFCEVDVTSDEKVVAAFAKAREAHGQERILVNCAGVANAAKTVGRDKETKAPNPHPLQQFAPS